MEVETTERHEPTDQRGERREQAEKPAAKQPTPGGVIGRALEQLRTGLRELRWMQVLLFGVLSGVLMGISLLRPDFIVSLLVGLVPVGTGLIIGRRIKAHYGLHGFMTGLVGAVVGVVLFSVLFWLTPLGADLLVRMNSQAQPGTPPLTPDQIWVQSVSLLAFSLVTFSTFGASMSGRTEERNRQLREQVEARGGQLERAGTVRTSDDIRGFSLPQFGWYVNQLFKKKGFLLKEYRFIDRDKHLDMWMEYEGEPWHLRLTVVDKVSTGTIEGLHQELKREGGRKGVVLTSTEFLPSAIKSAKGRPIVLIDGQTLFEIAEG